VLVLACPSGNLITGAVLVEDLTAAVEDEVVVGGDFRKK
jgi:hypothetical protein